MTGGFLLIDARKARKRVQREKESQLSVQIWSLEIDATKGRGGKGERGSRETLTEH